MRHSDALSVVLAAWESRLYIGDDIAKESPSPSFRWVGRIERVVL